MPGMNQKALATLNEIRAKHKHYVAAHEIKGNYYLYENLSKWDPERRKPTIITFYLGHIDKEGNFIAPMRRKNLTKSANNLDEYIKKRSSAEYKEQTSKLESVYENIILKELSSNPRIGVAGIARKMGLQYGQTSYYIKKLEKKYGIRYTIEPGFLSHFGLSKFIAIAKFKDKRPNVEKLQKAMEANPNVQLAFLARGAYDLFIFFLAKDPFEAEQLIYEIRKGDVLADCTAEWFASYYTQGIGFIPIRDEFMATLEQRVWHRSRDQPRKQKDQILLREYATLRELNRDGLIPFIEIDRKYSLNEGSALYTYQQLLKSEMIFRVTMTMQTPPIKDTVVFIVKQLNVKKFLEHRKGWLFDALRSEDELLNRYVFFGDIGSPYGAIQVAPSYKDGDIEKLENSIYISTKGIEIETSIISKFLVGNFSYRKLETNESATYKIYQNELENEQK
jgi:DNA-binding Lrp family transcriptional regulator